MRTTKNEFLRAHAAYGYGPAAPEAAQSERRIDRLREDEFPQLSQGTVYLDHAGATLYAKSQLQRSFEELQGGVFGNPHSHAAAENAASADGSTASRVAAVRRQVLAFFNASEEKYAVVFTSGATAALKIVGESFPWSANSTFAHSMDSHTSVLGLRGFANDAGATVASVPLDEMDRLEKDASTASDANAPPARSGAGPFHLLAFPAECNFSGTQHNLDLISHVQHNGLREKQGRWLVLLDAAKFVATHPLDLQTHSPDFVALSFYKMFGYPTGAGALLVHRKHALPLLEKRYYGGGTVANILATKNFVRLRETTDAARLEDGTVSFLSILSLRHGLDFLQMLSMKAIETHTAAVGELLRSELEALTHWNGVAAANVYGRARAASSIVSFNFRRVDASYVGYAEVGKLAAIHGIHLRTGCFCNPGACQWHLGLNESDLMESIAAGHVCGDDVDLVNGLPTGAVRLSVGYMTSYEDIAAFVAFARKYFVACAPLPPLFAALQPVAATEPTHAVLRKIVVFPIKSCAGMSVDAWPVGSRGLLFDREWAILDASTRKALTLKDAPEMCFLDPRVDMQQQTLTIRCRKSGDGFTLPLYAVLTESNKDAAAQDMRVCAAPCKGRDVGDDVSQWLSRRLQRACRLVRVAADCARTAATSSSSSPSSVGDTKIGFANQAQFLLISRASVANVNESLRVAGADMQIREDAFRANIVVDSGAAFAEDKWAALRIGDVAFEVTGPCSRCSMVNIDPLTGAFHRAPLQVLSRYRRERSNIFFGQFLALRVPPSRSAPAASRAGDAPPPHAGVAWLRCGTHVDVEVTVSPLKPESAL